MLQKSLGVKTFRCRDDSAISGSRKIRMHGCSRSVGESRLQDSGILQQTVVETSGCRDALEVSRSWDIRMQGCSRSVWELGHQDAGML